MRGPERRETLCEREGVKGRGKKAYWDGGRQCVRGRGEAIVEQPANVPYFQLVVCCVYSIQRHSYLASSGSFSAHHLFLLLHVNIRSAMSGAIRSGSVQGATSLMTEVL